MDTVADGAHDRPTVIKKDMHPDASCVEKSSVFPCTRGGGRLARIIERVIGHLQGLDGRKVSYSCAFEFTGTCSNNFLFPLACGDELFCPCDPGFGENAMNGLNCSLMDMEYQRLAPIKDHVPLLMKDVAALPVLECNTRITWRADDMTNFDPGGLIALEQDTWIYAEDALSAVEACIGIRGTSQDYKSRMRETCNEIRRREQHEEEVEDIANRLNFQVVLKQKKCNRDMKYESAACHEEECAGPLWIGLGSSGYYINVTVDKWRHEMKNRNRILIKKDKASEQIAIIVSRCRTMIKVDFSTK